MDKLYRENIKKHGLLDILDLFDYKLTAITRATALMELRRIVFYNNKVEINHISKNEWQKFFLKFRNYLEFEVKEVN